MEAKMTINTAYTYQVFINLVLAEKSINKTEQEAKNLVTTLNIWLKSNKLNINSAIKNEFNGTVYEQHLDNFINYQFTHNLKKSTINSRKSLIKKLRRFYEKITEIALSDNFGDCLKYLIESHSCSIRSFASKLEICESTLQNWVKNQSRPKSSKASVIAKIEEFFSLEPETLKSKLPKFVVPLLQTQGDTNFGRKISENKQKKYLFLSELAEEEIAKLIKFKTLPYLDEGLRRRSKWTVKADGSIPSAKSVTQSFAAFLGFCLLPKDAEDPKLRGAGFNENQLSISLITEVDLVKKFLFEFLFTRHNNQITSGFLVYLNSFIPLLDDTFGFLPQHSEIGKKNNPTITHNEWLKKCYQAKQNLKQLRSDIYADPNLKRGRELTPGLKSILLETDPLDIISEMINEMLIDNKKITSKIEQAVHFREIILIGILQSNPFRSATLEKLEFDKTLIKNKAGKWLFNLGKEHFKNHAKQEDEYIVEVNKICNDLLDRYVTEFYPILQKGRKTNYVFLKKVTKESTKEFLSSVSLSVRAKLRTAQYLGADRSLRCHAFRYIVATHFYKLDPIRGIVDAANALNDSIEMVEKTYIIVTKNEKFIRINYHTNQSLDKFIKNKDLLKTQKLGGNVCTKTTTRI